MLRGLRQSSIVVEGSIVTSTQWDIDINTMAFLCYFSDETPSNFYCIREGQFLFGISSFNPATPTIPLASSRDRVTTDKNTNSGATFMLPIVNRFAWVFAIDFGDGVLPDNGYCILGERAVMQTSGWTLRQAGAGALVTPPNPLTYGSRDNATAFPQMPFYAHAQWDRALTLDEMTRLANWDVPLDPIVFVLNDTGRDLSGNGHHVTFNDLEQNRVDNAQPALRIPAR